MAGFAMRSLCAAVFISVAVASPFPSKPLAEPDPSLALTVDLNGKAFVNKGMVGFGLIPSNFRESTGDTFGGVGSAIAMKRGTFRKNANGTFSGTLTVQPDRGFNIDGTVDYQGRQHDVDFLLTPHYTTDNLSFADAQQTLQLTYKKTLLYVERENKKTTGLDALSVRPQELGFPAIALADPPMPIPDLKATNRLTLDLEGLVLNADGTFWISDEYGPYGYRFDSTGHLIQTIQPPAAILPENANGSLNFTSVTNPTTGRVGNQGFEGMAVSPDGNTLFLLLQSATVQDGGDGDNNEFTRLLRYNIAPLGLEAVFRPELAGEWVVPLPVVSGNVMAQSETHYISENVFFVLARDGDGHGGNKAKSKYKQADLIDITHATDIHNTKFDSPQHPVAPNGTLDPAITPALYVPFLSFINDTQLARFGMHNGNPVDQTLIDGKWESLALAPVDDPQFPNDYFLFTAADNDFLSTQGFFDGQPFNAGLDNDNQFMVFRVTLPTVVSGSVQQAIGIQLM